MRDVPDIRFVQLSPETLVALIDGDLAAASAAAGTELSQYLVDEAWLWHIRLDQIRADPASAEWIARAAQVEGVGVVGHGGFHGPPDDEGVVEVAYSVAPEHRRQGYAKAMLRSLLERADADERVTAVRASIRPDNVASRATIAGFGFKKIGEQWDPEDGLEDVFLRPAKPAPSDKPAGSGNPTRLDKSARSGKPAGSENPARSGEPAEPDKPVGSDESAG